MHGRLLCIMLYAIPCSIALSPPPSVLHTLWPSVSFFLAKLSPNLKSDFYRFAFAVECSNNRIILCARLSF